MRRPDAVWELLVVRAYIAHWTLHGDFVPERLAMQKYALLHKSPEIEPVSQLLVLAYRHALIKNLKLLQLVKFGTLILNFG